MIIVTEEETRLDVYYKFGLHPEEWFKIEDYIEENISYGVPSFKKYDWHREYHKLCCLINRHECKQCHKFCYPNQLVIHHISYHHKKGIYNIDLFEAIDKIKLLCKDCHKWIHENFIIDGKTKIIDEKLNCIDCNNLLNIKLLNTNGRCGDCEFYYNKQMNEYLF
jgi:hypothetical protein